MKVLFLATEVPDYHQDMVCHGLVELLGAANVRIHPRTPRYHEAPPPALVDSGMSYLALPEQEQAPLEELAADCDAVVVGALRKAAMQGFRRLLEARVDKPLAVLDGLDDPYVRGAIRVADVYFKRETLVHPLRLRLRFPARRLKYAVVPHDLWSDELRRQIAVAREGVPKLVPLPLAAVPVPIDRASDVRWDVAFAGSPTSPERVRLLEELGRLRAEGLRVLAPGIGQSEGRLPWRDYMGELSASRVAISVRGAGLDTLRYWEIPWAGAALVAETPGIRIPHDFVDGAEAVHASPERLVDAVRRLLAGDPAVVAAAGHAALRQRHLSRHRAAVVLDRLAAVAR